jgi:transcription termination factor Rho
MNDTIIKSIQNLKEFMKYNNIQFREKKELKCEIAYQKSKQGYFIPYGTFEVFFAPDTNYPFIQIDELSNTDFQHSTFSTQHQIFEFNKEENSLIIKGESATNGKYKVKLKT